MDFQKADGPVLNAINKYKCNSSTVIIKIKIEFKSIFPFTPVQYEEIFLEKLKMFQRHHNKVIFQLNIDRE